MHRACTSLVLHWVVSGRLTKMTGVTTVESRLTPPPVLWAQRKSLVYLKVALEDCKNPTIKLDRDSLYFKGTGGTEAKEHEVTLHFLHPIKPEDSRHVVHPRGVEFVLQKAEEGPFWNRLLKEDTKFHWLKVDFNRWMDEDDSGDELGGGGGDFEEMMRQMGGLGDDPSGGDLDNTGDSDDEEIPDLESSKD